MTITEHKRLVAAIPDDLVEGEEIEVRTSDGEWRREKFALYFSPKKECEYIHGVMDMDGVVWPYVRRPAAAQKKRLKDEPWPKDPYYMYRCVMSSGCAMYSPNKPCLQDNPLAWRVLGVLQKNDIMFSKPGEFCSTDWQNSLERRTE